MTITGDWWNAGSRPVLFNLADEVNSCMATTNLKTRSILVTLLAATSTEAAGQIQPCSTVNMVWSPTIPVKITGVYRFAQGIEEMATCDNFVLYGAAGACAAGILLKNGTTNPVAYTRTGATLYTACHAAGTNFMLRRYSSTCSVQRDSVFQIDYVTVD